MKKNKASTIQRREFLQLAGLLSGAWVNRASFMGLASILSKTLVDPVQAAGSGATQVKKLVYIHLMNGPPRWVWDLVLFGSGQELATKNSRVATAVSSAELVYRGEVSEQGAAVDHQGFRWPVLWSLPTLQELRRKNMLVLRGINNGIDSHTVGQRVWMHPNIDALSVSGLVADQTKKLPFGTLGINYSAGIRKNYVSQSEKAAHFVTVVKDDNSVPNKILSAFLANSVSLERAFSPEMDQVIALMRNLTERLPAEAVYSEYQNAQAMMRRLKGVPPAGMTASDYTAARARYKQAVERAFQECVAQKSLFGFDPASNSVFRGSASDFSNRMGLFLDSFASLEVSMRSSEELSRSFALSLGDVFVENDAHAESPNRHLLGFTLYYLGLSACLNELFSALGPLFNDTVVQVAGDFNRIPRIGSDSMDGSDHGWSGSVTSLFSGSSLTADYGNFSAGQVIGSIQEDERGVWGNSAFSLEMGSEYIRPLTVAAFLAKQLGFSASQIEALAGGQVYRRLWRSLPTSTLQLRNGG